jgi:uncharacterized protein (DUF952 family)
MIIYHIVLPEVWAQFEGRPSFRAPSLESEGFIHCSFESQLENVIRRYYGNVLQVVILHIETEKLRSKLVKEQSTGGEIYPHIYGRINMDSIVRVESRTN